MIFPLSSKIFAKDFVLIGIQSLVQLISFFLQLLPTYSPWPHEYTYRLSYTKFFISQKNDFRMLSLLNRPKNKSIKPTKSYEFKVGDYYLNFWIKIAYRCGLKAVEFSRIISNCKFFRSKVLGIFNQIYLWNNGF